IEPAAESPLQVVENRRCDFWHSKSARGEEKENESTTAAGSSTPDTLVDPAQLLHFPRVEKIAAVEEDGMGQALEGAGEIQLFEDGPLGRHHQCVATFGHVIHVRDVGDRGAGLQNVLRLVHRLRVMETQAGAVLEQPLTELDGRAEPDVVRVL